MDSTFMIRPSLVSSIVFCFITMLIIGDVCHAQKTKDAKNSTTGKAAPFEDPAYAKYGIYQNKAPVGKETTAVETQLPLALSKGAKIAFIGNTLLERSQHFGQFETMLHQAFPRHQLMLRNLTWPADTPNLQPRPSNFASTEQHLTYEKADVIVAAFGFNESFAGEAGIPAFRKALTTYIQGLQTKAFNGQSAPQIVLLSPIANENIQGVPAADNNKNIEAYAQVVQEVANELKVGYVDLYQPTLTAMSSPGGDLTMNGAHLNEAGYELFANTLFEGLFQAESPKVNEAIREVVIDKNRQYFRRYRPANTFYYTGGRSKTYGYLDFLPAMKNFDLMTSNRDQRIWDLAQGKKVPAKIDDSNLPKLPPAKEGRGANRWMSAADELKEFTIDPRFDVNLFAGEEEFPDVAAPIQMRWDSKGRLWVSCSTTYPHVYPGKEQNDKLVILEDTDGDGKADKSTVFAEDLHIPLSFEFGDGGVYVSEMPHLTFIKDTDGDGKADYRKRIYTGFGTEDSHHALHDFAWTPDGDLIYREAIFHHSQVESPYGPVRQQNSGWFRFDPETQRLTNFGTYHSTNPWGVTFDDWGQHMASHPVYAAAFHSLDPAYPNQHPKPNGLTAYSGTCGQEFVDFSTFPAEMQGGFIKARYKPTNRIEYHRWNETKFGFDEEYVSDIIFSSNLSFIPVDLRYGPRGAMYVCDWYNPIKGHAQYSLRDERRDRHSGRIWRITAKDAPLVDPPKIDEASIPELLEILKRPEYRYRYWTKRELRERNPGEVKQALDQWVKSLDADDPRLRHHQIEAIWVYRGIDAQNLPLLKELLTCEDHHARAAATEQLRYWHADLPNVAKLLNKAANDENGIVRMQAAIAATYIGSEDAFHAILDVLKHPREGHLAYAITCAFGSHTMKPYWENNPIYDIAKLLQQSKQTNELKEPSASAADAQFDAQTNLKKVTISCMPERMLFTNRQFAVTTDQPVKIVFTNPDATNHNLVIVKPGSLAEVGIAANEMAKNPKFANSDFIPADKKNLILHSTPMIGPTKKTKVHVLRFNAPTEPGIYPFVCTFPGHWIVMNGEIVVANDLADVDTMLANRKTTIVKQWKIGDFDQLNIKSDEATLVRGMQAFIKARCNQCHVVAGHGINLGADLAKVSERFKGNKLLQQIVEPSLVIDKKYQTVLIQMTTGEVISGVVKGESKKEIQLITNLLTPEVITVVSKKKIEQRVLSKVSLMPEGLLNVLSKKEIADLVSYLQAGDAALPDHLKHNHQSSNVNFKTDGLYVPNSLSVFLRKSIDDDEFCEDGK